MVRRVLCVAVLSLLVSVAVPTGPIAAEPAFEPTLGFERVPGEYPEYRGAWIGELCAEETLSRVAVSSDGTPLFAINSPLPTGETCGPGGAGSVYRLAVDESLIEQHQGVHTIGVALSFADGSTRSLTHRLLFRPRGVVGGIDSVTRGATTIRVRGWALDFSTSGPAEVSVGYPDLHDHRYGLGDFNPGTTVRADRNRPDIAAAYPGYGAAHGFDVTLPLIWGVCMHAEAIEVQDPVRDPLRLVHDCAPTPNEPVRGAVDYRAAVQRSILVSGWVADADGPAKVVVSFNGLPVVVEPNRRREGVSSRWNTGWAAWYPMAPGTYEVCVYFIDNPSGDHWRPDCQQVVVK